MKSKSKKVPTSKLSSNTEYLRNTNVQEARKVVESSKDLERLINKTVKFMLK